MEVSALTSLHRLLVWVFLAVKGGIPQCLVASPNSVKICLAAAEAPNLSTNRYCCTSFQVSPHTVAYLPGSSFQSPPDVNCRDYPALERPHCLLNIISEADSWESQKQLEFTVRQAFISDRLVVAQACYLGMERKVISFGIWRACVFIVASILFIQASCHPQEQPWEILVSCIDLCLEATQKRPGGLPCMAVQSSLCTILVYDVCMIFSGLLMCRRPAT